jgi:hypothetical protein
MADNSVQVELSVDEQKAIKSLASVVKKFDELGTAAKDNIKKSDIAFSSFVGNIASTAVTKGIGLITSGISTLVGSIEGAVKASAEEATALQTLNIALAQTGTFTSKASKEFAAFAGKIETTTGIQTEAIFQTAAYIQQVNKLSNKDLKQVTQATVDFSSALGIDLGSATTLVSKALEGNTKVLAKYGIEVQKGSTEAQTLTNVLKALEGQQGAAEAKTKTFAGGFTLLETNIGNFQKSIGFLIAENPAVIAALTGLSKGIAFLSGIVEANKGAITDFVTNAVLKLVEGLNLAASVFSFFNKGIAGVQITAKLLEQSFFAVDIALSKFGLGLDSVLQKVQEFSNIDLGAGQQKYIAAQEASISNSKEQITAIDGEINAIVNRTSAQNKAASEFTSTVVNATKSAIDQQKALTASGNEDFLNKLNEKSQAVISNEVATIEAVQLLRETQAGLDLQRVQDNKLLAQLSAEENFNFLAENLGREEALREVARAEELAKTAGTDAAKLQLQAAYLKAQKNQVGFYAKFEEQTNKERLANFSGTLGAISALSSSSNAELFEIGKAAAIGTATIDGIAAVQKALASAPPPFNFALAALVGTATALNIKKIASQKRPKFADGGFVGGSSFTGDRVVANVNSGEVVLNASQQRNFMDIANGGGNSGIMTAIESLGNKIQNMNIIVQADGREIARLVRDQKLAGFAL